MKTRKQLIEYIVAHAGDEIETIADALRIAKMTDKELKDDIKSIRQYYKVEYTCCGDEITGIIADIRICPTCQEHI